MNHHQAFVQNL